MIAQCEIHTLCRTYMRSCLHESSLVGCWAMQETVQGLSGRFIHAYRKDTKYSDHLPLNRLQGIFRLEDELARKDQSFSGLQLRLHVVDQVYWGEVQSEIV